MQVTKNNLSKEKTYRDLTRLNDITLKFNRIEDHNYDIRANFKAAIFEVYCSYCRTTKPNYIMDIAIELSQLSNRIIEV